MYSKFLYLNQNLKNNVNILQTLLLFNVLQNTSSKILSLFNTRVQHALSSMYGYDFIVSHAEWKSASPLTNGIQRRTTKTPNYNLTISLRHYAIIAYKMTGVITA